MTDTTTVGPFNHPLKVVGTDIGQSVMMAHAGGVETTYEELAQVPLPQKTSSYVPVGHTDFVESLYKNAEKILVQRGFALEGQRYVTSHEGSRMFFVHSFHNGDSEMGLAIAGRNSYDKSMRAALAAGARVFNCDNLCINGEITVQHRHTGNVIDYLSDQIILKMHRAEGAWDDMRTARDSMVECELSQEEGYALMGLAKAGTSSDKGASQRLLTTDKDWRAVQQYWEHPEHNYEGGNRTLWAWYNSFTFNFRDLKPQDQLPRHARLHKFATDSLKYNPTLR